MSEKRESGDNKPANKVGSTPTHSPYDLNAEAERRKINQEENCQHKKTGQFHHSSDDPSSYDLSSHGGLAALARKARKNPLCLR